MDVVSEILLLLPLRHLLSCASVCRRWRALLNGSTFLKLATERHLTSYNGAPPLRIRPALPAPTLAALPRWLQSGLDEKVMNKYLTVICDRLNCSGYFTRGSVGFYLRSTIESITDGEYNELFRRRGRPIGTLNPDLIIPSFDPFLRIIPVTLPRHLLLNMNQGNHWAASFKETFQQPRAWFCSNERPRQLRIVWGVLKKLMALMKYNKRYSSQTVKSRTYAANSRLAGDWKIFVITNARFTVAIVGNSC